MKITLTQPQYDFLNLTTELNLFCAGYGSGKSTAMSVISVLDAMEGGSASITALFEPTYHLINRVAAKYVQQRLNEYGFRFKYNKNEKIIYTSSGQIGDFIFGSLDNPDVIVGDEFFRSHADESDTLKVDHAREAHEKIMGRTRQIPKTYKQITNAPMNCLRSYSTPEGYQYCHLAWVEEIAANPELKKERSLVQAPSYSNPHLPKGYIQRLRSMYPPQLAEAYIEGRFVNMKSGSVYANFDRIQNHTDEEIQPFDTVLHIGADHNVTKTSAAVVVYRDKIPHVVDEFIGIYDTPELINAIQQRYWTYKNGRWIKDKQIVIYPDASGAARKTVNASVTDRSLLEQAGFTVRVDASNPPIIDRVNSLNAMICNGKYERRLFVNTRKCPKLTGAIEKQAWGDNGLPDKKQGHDNLGLDGLGYLIYQNHPINFTRTYTTGTSTRR